MSTLLKGTENFSYPITEILLSNSTLMLEDSCSRKFEFSKMYGFNVNSDSLSSIGGQILHECMAVWYKTKSKDETIYHLIRNYPISLCSNPLWNWSREQMYASLICLINYLERNKHLELAQIRTDAGELVPAVEVPFVINMKHNIPNFYPVKYRGFIDFVFYNRIENSYFVIDLKNTAWNLSDYTPLYRYSPQILPYGLVLSKALGEEITSLEVEYLVNKLDLMNPRIIPIKFLKSKEDIQEWFMFLHLKLMNLKTYTDLKWFPRTPSGCISFSRKCKFYDLCSSRHPQTIQLMIDKLVKEPREEPVPLISLDVELV